MSPRGWSRIAQFFLALPRAVERLDGSVVDILDSVHKHQRWHTLKDFERRPSATTCSLLPSVCRVHPALLERMRLDSPVVLANARAFLSGFTARAQARTTRKNKYESCMRRRMSFAMRSYLASTPNQVLLDLYACTLHCMRTGIRRQRQPGEDPGLSEAVRVVPC